MRGALPIGTVIKGYRVDSILSDAGNFAIIYLGHDIDAGRVARRKERIQGRLGRWRERYGQLAAITPLNPGPTVALKEYAPRDLAFRRGEVVSAQPGKAEVFAWSRERFQQESLFLAEHSHPNVVAVYDRFAANNTEYYVMEHLAGGSLTDILERHPQSDEEMRRWLMPVLQGLMSVERRNADHLDISPGNIMFRNGGDNPVLVDFGASRIASATPRHASKHFIVDSHFAAPEKYSVTSRNLDARSDIYSLGAIMQYALTGEIPTAPNLRVSGSPMMSDRARAMRAARISPALERVIDKATALDMGERYADAASLIEAISKCEPSVSFSGNAAQALRTNPSGGAARQSLNSARRKQDILRRRILYGVIVVAVLCLLVLLLNLAK